MTKGQGVVIIKYVDDKLATNPISGIVNSIFFNVDDVDFLHQSKMLVIFQDFGDDENFSSMSTTIPMSNIGIMEHFATNEDFHKAYPQIEEMKGDQDEK